MREHMWLYMCVYILRYLHTNIHIYVHNYIHTSLYIKGIYQIGLLHVVWVVKLWLFHNRKADNLVVIHSTRLDVLAVLSGARLLNVESWIYTGISKKLVLIPEEGCLSKRRDEFVSQSEGRKEKCKVSFFLFPLIWATIIWCSPNLVWVFLLHIIWVKTILCRSAQQIEF